MLLGLCGYAGCGKDTAAQVLLEEWNFQRVAFADPIKKALLALDPLVPAESGEGTVRLSEFATGRSWSEVNEFPEVRRLMQVLGTEVGRNLFDPDLWVRLAADKLAGTQSVGSTVVTDVRFPNEARLIKSHGGHLVRITRPEFGPVNEHVSDRASENWTYDFHLVNDADIPALHQKMRDLVSQLETQNG